MTSNVPLLIQTCFSYSVKIPFQCMMPCFYFFFFSYASPMAVQNQYASPGAWNIQRGSVVPRGRLFLEELRNGDFRIRLAYLADVFGEFNELKKKLKWNGKNILVQTKKINVFVADFDFGKWQVERVNFASLWVWMVVFVIMLSRKQLLKILLINSPFYEMCLKDIF